MTKKMLLEIWISLKSGLIFESFVHLINMDIQFVSSCESQRAVLAIVFKRPRKVNAFNMIPSIGYGNGYGGVWVWFRVWIFWPLIFPHILHLYFPGQRHLWPFQWTAGANLCCLTIGKGNSNLDHILHSWSPKNYTPHAHIIIHRICSAASTMV